MGPPYLPVASMYGIFIYIYHKYQPNVGKYTIHGWYGRMGYKPFFFFLGFSPTWPTGLATSTRFGSTDVIDSYGQGSQGTVGWFVWWTVWIAGNGLIRDSCWIFIKHKSAKMSVWLIVWLIDCLLAYIWVVYRVKNKAKSSLHCVFRIYSETL